MRVQSENGKTLDISNIRKTSSFKITANGTAFQILSSGLYSDKIRAVIRELSCNASDAHVAANKKNVPIEVTLPTEKDLTFKVKDFGTGLDDDQVVSLYTNYFESDKRDNNSLIGGFGLGSKSPFAYTDSFTVVAVKDGVSRVYSAYLTGGAPAITMLSEQNTTEPNGVEVSFLTKRSDIQEFQNKAIKVFTWFDVMPIIHNLSKDTVALVKDYSYQGNYVYIPSKKHTASGEQLRYSGVSYKPVVVMGNVCYPLNIDALATKESELHHFLSMYVELRIPIGSVHVAASREELQYDPDSKEYLLNTLTDELALFKKYVNSFLTTDQTKWTNLVKAYTFTNSLTETRTFSCFLDKQPNKQLLNETFTYNHVKLSNLAGSVAGVNVYWYGEQAKGKKIIKNGKYKTGKNTNTATMLKDNKTTIVIGDSLNTQEIMLEYRKNDKQNVLFVTTSKAKLPLAIKHAQEIAHELGGMPILNTSDYLKNIKTPLKKSTSTYKYVELDERIMKMHDIKNNSDIDVKLGEVDASERYYILMDTSVSGSSTWFLNDPVNDPNHLVQNKVIYGLTEIDTFLHHFVSRTKWKFTTKYLPVKPGELKTLKLVEKGWKPFLPALYQELTTTYMNDYKIIQNRYPQVMFQSRYNYCYDWLTLLVELRHKMSATNQDSFNDLFDKIGLRTDIDGYAKNVVTQSSTTLLDITRNFALRMSPLDSTNMLYVKTTHDRSTELTDKYPGLALVNVGMLDILLKSNPVLVINVFKAVLV